MEIISPKAVWQPYLVGITVMGIANTFWFYFAIQQKWSALTVSFLFSLIIVENYSLKYLSKLTYFILNGLIIFSMAMGNNSIIPKITTQSCAPYLSQQFPTTNSTVGKLCTAIIKNEPKKSVTITERKFFDSWFN